MKNLNPKSKIQNHLVILSAAKDLAFHNRNLEVENLKCACHSERSEESLLNLKSTIKNPKCACPRPSPILVPFQKRQARFLSFPRSLSPRKRGAGIQVPSYVGCDISHHRRLKLKSKIQNPLVILSAAKDLASTIGMWRSKISNVLVILNTAKNPS